MRASRLPDSRPAPVATLPPWGGSESGTFSMAKSGTFSTAVDRRTVYSSGDLCEDGRTGRYFRSSSAATRSLQGDRHAVESALPENPYEAAARLDRGRSRRGLSMAVQPPCPARILAEYDREALGGAGPPSGLRSAWQLAFELGSGRARGRRRGGPRSDAGRDCGDSAGRQEVSPQGRVTGCCNRRATNRPDPQHPLGCETEDPQSDKSEERSDGLALGCSLVRGDRRELPEDHRLRPALDAQCPLRHHEPAADIGGARLPGLASHQGEPKEGVGEETEYPCGQLAAESEARTRLTLPVQVS